MFQPLCLHRGIQAWIVFSLILFDFLFFQEHLTQFGFTLSNENYCYYLLIYLNVFFCSLTGCIEVTAHTVTIDSF